MIRCKLARILDYQGGLLIVRLMKYLILKYLPLNASLTPSADYTFYLNSICLNKDWNLNRGIKNCEATSAKHFRPQTGIFRFLLLHVLPNFLVGDDAVGSGKLDGVLDVDGQASIPDPAHGVVDAALDVVADLEVVLLELDLLLHLGVGVVDDGQEHVLFG